MKDSHAASPMKMLKDTTCQIVTCNSSVDRGKKVSAGTRES